MADADSIGYACAANGCSCHTVTIGWCAKHYAQLRTHGIVGPRQMCCLCCGLTFYSERKKKYCSKVCNSTAQNRKAGSVPKAVYLERVSNPENKFCCEFCGKQTYRRPSGSNRASGYANRWCSMACRVAQGAATVERKAQESKKAAAVRALVRAIKSLAKQLSPPEPAHACTCEACGVAYERRKGRSKVVCQLCMEQRKVANKLKHRELRRKNPKHKAAKLKAKAIRRSKERCTEAQAIDPFKVFDRDKWRCQLCGVSTPKRLRGTYVDKAPELDHVVPLALGGSHTWANVQCACRACNSRKGARALGQIGLGFEA